MSLRHMVFSGKCNDPALEETSIMTQPVAGGVDCDLHPAVPHLTSLLPYLNDYWRDQVTTRGMVDLISQSYPQNSPIVARPNCCRCRRYAIESRSCMTARLWSAHRPIRFFSGRSMPILGG